VRCRVLGRETWRVLGRETWRVLGRETWRALGREPCRKHCLTRVMRPIDAYFEACRMFDRAFDRKLSR